MGSLTKSFQLSFSLEHIDVFKNISKDTNLLHTSQEYASKTPLGMQVVYGIASVFKSLGLWSEGRHFTILKAKIKFKKPLYVNENYRVEIEEKLDANKVSIKITKGNVSYTTVSIQFEKWKRPYSESKPALIIKKVDLPEEKGFSQNYSPELKTKDLFQQFFDFDINQIPWQQFTFLCWSSYFVGMVYPGKQALFTQLEFSSVKTMSSNDVSICRVDNREHIGAIIIDGQGPSINNFTIKSLKRPKPISYSFQQVAKEIQPSNYYEGKTVLITGANRGLGSILAKAFALKGADLILTCRNISSISQVQEELSSYGAKVFTIQANLSDEKSDQELFQKCENLNHPIDVVINNASPFIRPLQFDECDGQFFIKEVNKYLSVSINTLTAATNLLKKNGSLINISSSFVQTPEKGFSPYIAAKSATEGLLRALSLEQSNNLFYNVVMPRILTDQTNTNLQKEEPHDPILKVKSLMGFLEKKNSPGKLNEINLTEK